MLSRAFTVKPIRWSPRQEDMINSSRSGSILEYSEDSLVGFIDDLPIIFCGQNQNQKEESQLTLREVIRASVGVIGESRLGMTEKAVLLQGQFYAVKRFRRVCIGRNEFGKRIQRLSNYAQKSDYLVPISAYLYSKRIKFVLCHYFPMGSLADLLAGGRELGHTALDWKQRLMIAIDIAHAIGFIHTQCPPYEKHMQLNVHGNIKASNVMINTNFTACLSDYGFLQLAEFEEVSETGQGRRQEMEFCQKSDIYNFGTILLDMLGGAAVVGFRNFIKGMKQQIENGDVQFFEFPVEGKEGQQALMVLDIALLCTNHMPEARPSIENILRYFDDIIMIKK